ncbi:Calcipressin-domain-containing protein [Aaosphaeria arxii CBS 175.79]|uniref:Calcipressin-domain-containing protein n=1 Tax=Aaosphaeria arxii CBS 175.79 TaxID=1450172 RepID=A0A6A5XVU8_9PLEO|nr:Calcipressin-domain-containing protein [Aaosphaeria arxii CBS 175.79]KAF2017053.1 Calcipressin-domain-containing protein [Aaosphaeria arxii CBS 175.79]
MSAGLETPTRSRASSRTKSPQLSIDLSDLPPLVEPSPPSNTLIITNLQEPEIFEPSNLVQIREIINQHAAIHTWAPLKSFRRIVTSFFDIDSAIRIRQNLDGETLMGSRIRVYFGLNTPLNPTDQHLPLPQSDKLFFISPPPSPPMGWEMRNEEAPNTLVHAEDLAAALAKLHADHDPIDFSPTNEDGSPAVRRRRTGSSTIVYHPEDHGDSPLLPAIAVEDTTDSPAAASPSVDAMEGVEGPIAQQKAQGQNVSTARPPVEFMH